jgi:hypothetical protein
MQFASESNSQDIVSDAYFWSGADSTSYPIAAVTRNCNFALDRVTSLIMRVDGRWAWDDSNNSTYPITNASVVSGTAGYAIPVTYLDLFKVRIKDSAGNWISLERVTRDELTDGELTATSGDPRKYYLFGNYIFFVPAPNYSSTNGIEYQFSRAPSYFVITDTTKTPGFASQFHRLISLGAAADYCRANNLTTRLQSINAEILKLEGELTEFYTNRSADVQPSMKVADEDFGQDV